MVDSQRPPCSTCPAWDKEGLADKVVEWRSAAVATGGEAVDRTPGICRLKPARASILDVVHDRQPRMFDTDVCMQHPLLRKLMGG
jgi:hypothetical protein